MIHLATSHRTEALLDAFVANVAGERQRLGPFATVRVVVPNRNVETYLRLGVSERCGIAANIETTFLRRFLAEIAEGALPGTRVADAIHVEGQLLALLHDDALLAQSVLAPVHGFVTAAGQDRDAVDRRRCQLATTLAQLFDEYASSRPDMLASWAKGQNVAPGAVESEHHAWQRALWLEIFGPAGRLAADTASGRRQALEDLWDKAMAQDPAPFAGQTLHIFGLSYIATAYHRMLAALAAKSDVHIYVLGPCREDFGKRSASANASPQDPFGLAEEPQPALRLWARPGRENLRLLAELNGAQVDARFAPGEGERKTLLRRLQDDIVNRRVAEPDAAIDALDDSLRVLPCPSLRRELEVVAAEIWSLARKDPSLRLCDVAVIVPEASKELYLAQISAVFGESCDLPHNVADLPAIGSHRVAGAIELLLRLPISTFSRKDFLPLLTHPCLLGRFPEATPAAWRALASDLGIVRGADRHDLDGTYVRRDLFTWEQGLRRLALGALLDGTTGEDMDPLTIAGESYLPGPLFASDESASLGFGLLARSLLADARFAAGHGKTEERPLHDWLTFIRGLVSSYLVLDKEDDAGQAIVTRFLAALDELADIGLGDLPISYRIAAELALRILTGLPWSRGHYLANGVTVASFVPMRAIPFRAVFVLGLGQNAFPRPARRAELDLRGLSREVGDVNRREQDLYMFLETLLSARDHVVLSYVGRDEVTGDELPASAALFELRTMLAEGYLKPPALARLFGDDRNTWPPLHRFSDNDERRALLPAAESEHRAKLLGAELLSGDVPALPSGSHARNSTVVLGKTSKDAPSTLVIPLSTLFQFLRDPLQGSARFRLRMAEDDDEALADVEDEPFDLDRRTRGQLLRETMPGPILAAQGAPTWESVQVAHARRSLAFELAGCTPTGHLREVTTESERQLLLGWRDHLSQLIATSPADCRTIQLVPGRTRLRNGPWAYQPAPSFALESVGPEGTSAVAIRIEGRAGLWVSSPDSLDLRLAFSVSGKIRKKKQSGDDLRAFLDYVAVTAAGDAEEVPGAHSALFFPGENDSGDLRTLRFRPLTKARALAYLKNLCNELLTGATGASGAPTGVHPYLLPHEAVLSSQQDGSGLLDEIARLCDAVTGTRGSFSSVQGPVRSVLTRYAAPAQTDAERMVDGRFGLFFELASEEPS